MDKAEGSAKIFKDVIMQIVPLVEMGHFFLYQRITTKHIVRFVQVDLYARMYIFHKVYLKDGFHIWTYFCLSQFIITQGGIVLYAVSYGPVWLKVCIKEARHM